MSTRNRDAFRAAASAAVILLALTFSHSLADALARLLRSQPAADSKQGQPPKLFELWFNEELETTPYSFSSRPRAATRLWTR